MESILKIEQMHTTSTNEQSRINQLEDTLIELYQSVCAHYGTISFAEIAPESFIAPYSTHSISIPSTKLNVTLLTNPPRLQIGTLEPKIRGPLSWEHTLTIEFPMRTTFVSFRYGGEHLSRYRFSIAIYGIL